MTLFEKWRGIATEVQAIEQDEEISLVRDARGNWVDEKTRKIVSPANEQEDEDADG